jgi:GT2 family glycosyltransferase
VDSQNELLQALRKQLEATERELANQKWVFERFLESPSWRLTSPIRWAARYMRALRDRLRGSSGLQPPAPAEARAYEIEEPDQAVSPQLKEFITATHRASLKNFLSLEGPLQLPCSRAPEISIILVLHNRAELTLHCLRSITEQDFRNIEVIIVDNASTDETAAMLARTAGGRIINNSENHNFLLAVNQAAREARGEYILLLNNDTEVMSGTIGAALNTIRSAPDIGAVGGRLILLDWRLQEAGSIAWRDGSCLGYGRGDNPFAPMYMFRRDVDYCSAAFLLTARATWERLGGFDEAFKPAYYEDSDYCARLWEHGLRVVYEPDAVVMHYEFGSSTNVSRAISLQREHQDLFASRHQGWLSKHPAAGAEAILPARMKHAGKRVLFFEDRVPHPWLGSGFPRARAILRSLLRQGYFVTFYPMDEFEESWSCVYSDMPREIEFMLGYGPPLLEPFLRHRHDYYDTIFVSRPHNMKLLQPLLTAHPEWFRNATLIYDAEALFAAREIEFRKVHGSPLPPEETQQIVKEEVALADLADTVIAVSEPERNEFQKYGINTVHVLGHSVAVGPSPRPFCEREGFLFVGAIHEDTTPNGDSVIWFLEEIFPRIQAELGDSIPFTIAGVNTSERVRRLGRLAAPAVRITGHLPDISGLYDSARVFVAPTRFSAGIPQKIHDAAARGVPVVGTPLLASQLGWQEGSPLLVAGDAETFARKCVQLYKDEALWKRLREAAIERIRTECSPELFENQLQSIAENGHRAHARGNA